jgi:vacuolar-type H+-ATPase subunit H
LFKELEVQKQEVQEMDRRYKETLMKMEKKFLEEKIRLQREANRKISDLASKAHKVKMFKRNNNRKRYQILPRRNAQCLKRT